MTVERDALIKQLRMYGNVEDLSDRTDEQLLNMTKGYVKKGAARQYADVCPYFTGVSHLDAYDWKIGCSLRKGHDVTPLETKSWASKCALHCFKHKNGKEEDFTHCHFYDEAQEGKRAMKQKYICKCGKIFEKESTSDTTGYRLGADFGPTHECYGCHFVVPIEEGYPDRKIVDHECRASKTINYRTEADIPRTRDSFHVAHVNTLDMVFAREIWEYSRNLDGLDDSRSEMDLRGTLYRSDGRFDLGLYFTKTKAGVASCIAISDKFFAGGAHRSGLTAEQEKGIVLRQIERSKEKAKADPAALSSAPDQTVSNDAQNLRSIDQITLEINFYKAQTAQNIIEIGKRLIEAKQQLQHGEWLPWLRDKVDFSERSARNFMEIAQQFSNRQPVADLPYTKLLALLQVPEAERDEFIQATHLVDGQDKTVSDMSKRELEQAIKERDEAQQNERLMRERCNNAEKAAAEAKKAKDREYDNYMDALAKAEKTQENLKTLRSNRQFDLQRITELEKQIKELESRPVDVAVQEPTEAEKQELRDEGFNNAKELYDMRLQQLRNELEQAKTEARSAAGFDRDEIVCAAASFRNTLDSVFENFLRILKLSPSNAIEEPVRGCIDYLRNMISDLEDETAATRNAALIDEDFDLPPADGMEG